MGAVGCSPFDDQSDLVVMVVVGHWYERCGMVVVVWALCDDHSDRVVMGWLSWVSGHGAV